MDEQKEVEKSPIEEAKVLLEENKKVLAETKAERQRIEKAVSENILGGKSPLSPLVTPKVETPREYKDRILRDGHA